MIVSGVGDAENSVFSSTGRLFVTGGDNVYEITKNATGGYAKKALYDGTGNFVGIVQYGNRMYAICSKYKTGFNCQGIDLGAVFSGGGIQAIASQLMGAFMDHVLVSMSLNVSN